MKMIRNIESCLMCPYYELVDQPHFRGHCRLVGRPMITDSIIQDWCQLDEDDERNTTCEEQRQ